MPTGVFEHKKQDLAERFWSKVNCNSDDQCWEWKASKSLSGYGYITINRKHWMAHRLAYELEVGEIPKDKELHHKCQNTSCVNPYHLTALSMVSHNLLGNSFSAVNARKKNCIHGHPFNQDNTYVDKEGQRHCRECHKIEEHNRYHRNRQRLIAKRR